jgi:PhnB protein
MQVQPYLFFDGRCEEAFEFYRSALGAESLMLLRFKDAPAGGPDEGCPGSPPSPDKILHMAFRIGETTILASDGRCEGKPAFQGFSLALQPSDISEADRILTALAEGGQVQVPLSETFFAPRFGIVADKFGISWMVVVQPREAAHFSSGERQSETAGV